MHQSNAPIHGAVESDNYELVLSIIRHGHDINICGKFNRSPLHVAAKTGNAKMAEILLIYGAKINLKNTHGFTAIYVAAVSNNLEVLQLLLGCDGVDVDESDLGGMSPLIAAACNGCTKDIIQALLKAGASLILTDCIGRCALDWAVAKNFNDIAAMLRTTTPAAAEDLLSDHKL